MKDTLLPLGTSVPAAVNWSVPFHVSAAPSVSPLGTTPSEVNFAFAPATSYPAGSGTATLPGADDP